MTEELHLLKQDENNLGSQVYLIKNFYEVRQNMEAKKKIQVRNYSYNRDSYQVACKFEVLENWYPTSELEPLDIFDYPELTIVLLDKPILLKQASIKQNSIPAVQSSSSKQVNKSSNNFINEFIFVNISI
ncbi:hypothetical protein C2G38_2211887 [Gigaspora rosea]|uniref:Uncharacterized protein n=1 Tax=Gigaspora rosea TaxID=44941 RepID=A0A397UDU3_9GLOM|nr:hypothetical protein C2G38_2211887 [Gigaspora rosea]